MPARAAVQDRRAEQGTKVWGYDFVIDQAEEDRRLCLMIVVDEYTRECFVAGGGEATTAEDLVRPRTALFGQCEPALIRSLYAPELMTPAVRWWLAVSGVRVLYIEPGSPGDNS